MDAKAKGSFGIRFCIIILGIILGILLFWLLGFVTKDIGRIKGPNHNEIRKKYVEKDLDEKQKAINKEIKEVTRKIKILEQQQRTIKDSSSSLQNTINQLLKTTEKFESPDEITKTINQSQTAFLEKQKTYEQNNQKIADLTDTLNNKKEDLGAVNNQIDEQEKEAQKEYDNLYRRHKLKVASIKLAILLPILIIASLFFMKMRSGPYWPLVWAFFSAAFLKTAFVVHAYFPKEYFKYIAIVVLIAIVLRILICFIRRIIKPKKDLLLKQYQQNYDKHICPVCSKPIQTNQLVLSELSMLREKSPLTEDIQSHIQAEYFCPSCGTKLYEKCQNCQQIRHSLLPYCFNCGAQKSDA